MIYIFQRFFYSKVGDNLNSTLLDRDPIPNQRGFRPPYL